MSGIQETTRRIRQVDDLSRGDQLFIKYHGNLCPHGQRKSLRELADFFECSTKIIRKVLMAPGPKFTKWERERFGLKYKYQYGKRGQILVEAEPIPVIAEFRKGLPHEELRRLRRLMVKMRVEERMPFANIALRFASDANTVSDAILAQRREDGRRRWGYIEKD